MIPTECITCVALPTKQQSVPPMIYRKMLLTQRRLVKISPAQFQGVMIQRSAFQAPRRRRGRFDIFLGMQKQMIFWIYFVLYRTGSELCCDNRIKNGGCVFIAFGVAFGQIALLLCLQCDQIDRCLVL